MRLYRQSVLLLCVASLVFSFAQQQDDERQKDIQKLPGRYGFELNIKPYVNFNFWRAFSGTEAMPVFYFSFHVQNDYLTFVRENEDYVSEYQATISVRHRDEKTSVFGKSWRLTRTLEDFDATNSKKMYQYHNFVIDAAQEDGVADLLPGEYDVVFTFEDHRSSRKYVARRNLTVGNENESDWRNTDITFLRPDSLAARDLPALLPSRNILEFNVAYDAMVRVGAEGKYQLNMRLFKRENSQDNLLHQTFDTVAFNDTHRDLSYALPYQKMDEGRYGLKLVFKNLETGQEKIIDRGFSVVWFEKPIYLYKVDLAIRPMKYLVPKATWQEVSGYSVEKQTEWFKKFWKERDKSEETVYNELQHEFFRRVTHSVRHFSTRFKEGWETDRGMVYILYGEPEEVDKQIYVTDSAPYIVWNYPSREATFVFVDEKGNGEYTLQAEKENTRE